MKLIYYNYMNDVAVKKLQNAYVAVTVNTKLYKNNAYVAVTVNTKLYKNIPYAANTFGLR